MRQLQRALSLIYPPQCPLCETLLVETGGVCGQCWRGIPFLQGLTCDSCGCGLLGESHSEQVFCDTCLAVPRNWSKGRAVLSYKDTGRRLVLSLKHGDRLDLVPLLSGWMAHAGREILAPETVLVPIPTHWSRLLSRRYNQAAELSRGLSKLTGLAHCADALVRVRRTVKQDGMSIDERFANVHDALQPNPKWQELLEDAHVVLIDDVMTSGATLTAATHALEGLCVRSVSVLVLARVEKDP